MSDIRLDPKTGLPVLPDDGNGIPRLLALLPQTGPMALPVFGDYHEPIPKDQWVDVDLFSNYNPPVLDQGQHGSCFPAGTRIRMADGTEKPIQDVRTLDEVLTAEGNIGRVVKTQVRPASGLLRLSLWGHSHLKATEEHPILTRRGYIAIKDVTIGDWVAMPRYLAESEMTKAGNAFVLTSNHVKVDRLTIRQERRIRQAGVVGRATAVIVRTPLPDILRLTPGAGRIFGLFLAEGNTDSAKVVWTFNINETDTLVAELVHLLKTEWGVEPNIQPKPLNGSVKVVLHGKPWAMLFESLCSTGSAKKRIHGDLMSGPKDFQKELLLGWLDGDGFERRTTTGGVTVSHDLALSMFDIAQGLGMRPSIRYSEPKASHNVKSRLPRWDIEMGGSSKDTYRCEMDETHVWRKVRGVEAEDFEGYVYNLEVEGDHSYVAEGIGVHNCVGHGGCTAFTLAWLLQGEELTRFSSCYLYSLINGGRDAGANIGDTIQALQTKGICLESTVPEGYVFRRQYDAAKADAEASQFKLIEAYKTNDPADVATAIQMRYSVADSLMVGRTFNGLNYRGISGMAGVDRGPGNHCVCKGGMKKLPDGTWAYDNQNSWRETWGPRGGRFYTTDAHIQAQGYYEAVVFRMVSAGPKAPKHN